MNPQLMNLLYLIVLVFVVTLGCAANNDLKPLTPQEEVVILANQKQVEADRKAKDAAADQTPEGKRYQASQSALQQTIQGVFNSRKLKDGKALLCDGPGFGGPCSDVPPGRIALRAVPPPAPAAPAKK